MGHQQFEDIREQICHLKLSQGNGVPPDLGHQFCHLSFESLDILALVSTGMMKDQFCHSLPLALDHSCENRPEVPHVSTLQLCHDPCVQQHQAEPPQGRLHFHHECVTQVHDGCLLLAAGAGVGRALNQDVPRVQVSMDKVVNKDLEDGKALEPLIPTKPTHTKTAGQQQRFVSGLFTIIKYITLGSRPVLETAVLKWHGCYTQGVSRAV